MTAEADFQATVRAAASFFGWRVYHTHDSRRSDPGFPDLVMVHRTHGLLFAELKAQKGTTTPQQVAWLEDLTHAGHRAYLWRPSDWPTIEDVLRGRA